MTAREYANWTIVEAVPVGREAVKAVLTESPNEAQQVKAKKT